MGRLCICEKKRKKELVEWWLLDEKLEKNIYTCLPCFESKRKYCEKKKKRKTKASNGIARVHHEKKRKERKRKDGRKWNKVEQEWLH